jgi:hypothetical protein
MSACRPACPCLPAHLPACRAEVLKWGQNLANQGVINPEAVDWVVEPKVDGLAVRVVYRWVEMCVSSMHVHAHRHALLECAVHNK